MELVRCKVSLRVPKFQRLNPVVPARFRFGKKGNVSSFATPCPALVLEGPANADASRLVPSFSLNVPLAAQLSKVVLLVKGPWLYRPATDGGSQYTLLSPGL